jgi:tetratricopeptide (TPR) repeat protein
VTAAAAAGRRERNDRPRPAGGGRAAAFPAIVLVIVCLVPSALDASARSESLYAQGLVPFRSESWADAQTLFDEAVQADPTDALATYYRGLARARLGRAGEAIADLERAIELRPDLPHAALDLGILYLEQERFEQAELWLRRAVQEPANRFTAALFLGFALFRSGEVEEARGFFEEAAKDPELRTAASYYDALSLLRLGETAQAGVRLSEVAGARPDTAIGQAAQRYLGAAPRPIAAEEKRWAVYGDVGFGYDSNVVLAPDDSTIEDTRGIDRSSDGRTVLAFGGRYRVYDSERVDATLSYDLHQSLYFQIDDFDLQGHRLRADVRSLLLPVQLGLSGTYDYYLLDFSGFFQQGTVVPWATLFEGRVAATQVYYRFRVQDFVDDVFDPYRDSFNHAVGLRQHFLLGASDRFVSVGYQYDDENPISKNGDDFQYAGHQFDARFHFSLLDWARGETGYLFRLEDYEFRNSRGGPPPNERRDDREHQLVFHLERPLTPYLLLQAEYLGRINDSNLDEFEYDRHVVSGGVRLHF